MLWLLRFLPLRLVGLLVVGLVAGVGVAMLAGFDPVAMAIDALSGALNPF